MVTPPTQASDTTYHSPKWKNSQGDAKPGVLNFTDWRWRIGKCRTKADEWLTDCNYIVPPVKLHWFDVSVNFKRSPVAKTANRIPRIYVVMITSIIMLLIGYGHHNPWGDPVGVLGSWPPLSGSRGIQMCTDSLPIFSAMLLIAIGLHGL